MLQNITIENFRCLRHVDVPLRPLTILIGPNDSGKSAFLAALMHASARPASCGQWDIWRGLTVEVSIVVEADEGGYQYRSAERIRIPKPDPLKPLGFYCLPSKGVAMQCEGYPDTGAPPVIAENGVNVAALLDYMLRRDRKTFDELNAALSRLVPGFERLEIATPDKSVREIDFVIDGGLRIPADQASVGVKLLLFFVSLAYHPTPHKLILIEEPENGVHPRRLEDVIRLLREITQGKHGGKAAQVILTTHSPHLLDYVDLKEDQVLVFRRKEDGSRTAQPADEERLKNFLDEFMLGEVWFNEGEEGLVRRDK